MPNTRNPNRPNHSSGADPGVGAVRIRSKSTPDAQDRLRRLFTLLVRYATADGTTPSENRSPKLDDEEADEKGDRTTARKAADTAATGLPGAPLTLPRPSGIISPTGWPGGADNTPGLGATC